MAIQIIPPSAGDTFVSSSIPPILKQVDYDEPRRRKQQQQQQQQQSDAVNGYQKHAEKHRLQRGDEQRAVTARAAHQNPCWGRFNGGSWLTTAGCIFVLTFCPVIVIIAYVALVSFSGSIFAALQALCELGPLEFAFRHAPRFSTSATVGYAFWVLFQAFLYRFLPGKTGYGSRTPAGHLLPYRVNGLLAWIVTHLAALTAVSCRLLDPAIIAKNWDGLIVAFNLYGYFLPAMAFAKAHLWPTHSDDRKFSGSMIYDYYMGIELNPRIGSWFDFKLFHNGRPGIVAWTLIDLSFTALQYQLHGFVTNSIIIVNILHAFYVVDFFVNEDWYLRTIDICHDHYGFYLAWGSMVWLPTMYTLQAQYLARFPYSLSSVAAAVILFIGLSGYTVFRSVNHQKDLARRTGGDCFIWGRKAKTLRASYETADGSKHETILLCSGWWGVVRHANYMGDLALSYAACAAAGLAGPEWRLLPWSYAIFMSILLVQRCIRDEARCRGKYGEAWDEYCKMVRWRLVPGIF